MKKPITLRGLKIRAGIEKSKQQARTFLVICRGAGIPEPVEQYRFAMPDRDFKFDFAWPEFRVALEVDGGLFSGGYHARPLGIGRDMNKFNEAAQRGWLLLRCLPGDKDTTRYRLNSKKEKTTTLEFYVPGLLNFSMLRILRRAFDARRELPPLDRPPEPIPPML